jgi:hypothetical protein
LVISGSFLGVLGAMSAKKTPWHATSAKMAILSEVSNKNGKSVGAILRMVFELAVFVRGKYVKSPDFGRWKR